MSASILLVVWSVATCCMIAAFDRQLWRRLPASLRAYLGMGWALVSIGVIQTLFTPMEFKHFDETALWFAMTGVAISLTGALNLLNLGKHLEDDGLRRVCLAANITIMVHFIAVATHRGAEPPHDPVSVVLMTVAALATLLGSGIHWTRRRASQAAM